MSNQQPSGWGMLPYEKEIHLAQFNTVTQRLQNGVGYVVLARPWSENPTDEEGAQKFALAQLRTYCDQHGLAFHEEQVADWHIRPLGAVLGAAVSNTRWERDDRLIHKDDRVAGYLVTQADWTAALVATAKRKAKAAAEAAASAAAPA